MRCEQVRDQLADYLTGALSEPVAEEIRTHLAACVQCLEEVAALERVWIALKAVPAEPPDSPAMRARFAAMLEGYEHGRDGATAAARWDRLNGWLAGWWPRQPVVQFSGAVALLLLGLAIGRANAPASPPQPNEDIAALRGELRDMRQMVTLSLMQQQSASERLKGVSWSGRLDDPGREVVAALLDTLMHDPNVNVRLASVDALARFGDEQMVRRGAVEALGRATSPLVQIALIDFVVGVQEKSSMETLRRLARDAAVDDSVRTRATWGLQQLG
jgi:hypothetical protein